MTRITRSAVLIVYGLLTWAESARADAVVDWNAIAVQATITGASERPGPTSLLDVAMVQAAVYDAVNAIDGRFRPYHAVIPFACGSPAAAAVRAAHDVLVNRFPDQTVVLDTTYHDYLANHGLSESDPGIAVGEQAAAAIVALRANDGSFPDPPPPPFIGGTEIGMWRPTISYLPGPPPSFEPMETPWLAKVTPFTLTSPSQFRAGPPPPLTSSQYARAFNEIKAVGAFSSTVRTAGQTDLAYFWATNYLIVWNHVLRDLASTRVSDIADSARLFALANFAMTDAVITAWDTKKHYVFWRAMTAIQEGYSDGNHHTDGDSAWQPLINTPNYPDYTSGANTITGAVTHMLKLFFRTNEMTFSVTTPSPLAVQKTRTYSRFSDAAEDVVNARIFEGIHFRFSDTTARRQGRQVANWVFDGFLQPIRCHHDDDGRN